MMLITVFPPKYPELMYSSKAMYSQILGSPARAVDNRRKGSQRIGFTTTDALGGGASYLLPWAKSLIQLPTPLSANAPRLRHLCPRATLQTVLPKCSHRLSCLS